MFKLYAMRHAKSSWDFPNLDDHDRPLNKRGVNSAKLICEFFIKKKSMNLKKERKNSKIKSILIKKLYRH